VFTAEDRNRITKRILELAAGDPRVVTGAVVGSLADSNGDRWSDIDLTFGIDDRVSVSAVLEDWTQKLRDELDALALLDLPSGATIYRVFLLPGGLQCDLSFSPASQFGSAGPRFRLLFGQAAEKGPPPPRPAAEVFGWAVAYARGARACIDRRRPWQAAYYISAVRDHALELACAQRRLQTRFGRGFDDLPVEILETFAHTLVRSLEQEELLRAFEQSVECLLREASAIPEMAAKAEPRIREWLSST
jgi:hypothetical protein